MQMRYQFTLVDRYASETGMQRVSIDSQLGSRGVAVQCSGALHVRLSAVFAVARVGAGN
jgi:hypothetical protein